MTAHKKLMFVALALLVLLAMPGPGQAADCPLLTKAEAEGILGEAVGEPSSQIIKGMAAGKLCMYRTSAPMAVRGGVGFIRVVVYAPKTMKAHDGVFQSGKKFYTRLLGAKTKSKAKLEKIAGLGDDAYWEAGPSVLHLLVGDTYLTVRLADLKKMSAKSRAELDKMVSDHRKGLALKAAKEYILPRLK